MKSEYTETTSFTSIVYPMTHEQPQNNFNIDNIQIITFDSASTYLLVSTHLYRISLVGHLQIDL